MGLGSRMQEIGVTRFVGFLFVLNQSEMTENWPWQPGGRNRALAGGAQFRGFKTD